MANFLVTGGAGFIGSHLATRLVKLGHQVRIFDNLSSGKLANIEHIAGSVDLVEGDMRHSEECLRACHEIDVVLHQAAIPSVPLSVENPQDSHDANITGTFNLLLAAQQNKVKRFVYAASSSAYGDTAESPKHEGIVPQPLSPYAVQKLTGEHYCRAFHECYGLQTISLRYFNVFGERQDPASQYSAAIPAFVTALLRDESPVVYGDGLQTRDFTYIDNVVHGNILAAELKQTSGQAVNLACGDRITVNQVIAKINDLLGKNIQTNHVPVRTGDIVHSCADITLARKLLSFEPQVSFDDGLSRAIDYYRSIA